MTDGKDQDGQSGEDQTMGDVPVTVSKRIATSGSRGLLDEMRRATRRQDRQIREANRPTGTERINAAGHVQNQETELSAVKESAAHALDEAARARGVADRAAYKAADAAETAMEASNTAKRAETVARRVDGSRVVSADARETPAIGPDPVRLVEERVPSAAGYGRARVSVAAFGSVPSRGPVALQVRLRVGDRVTAWVTASYAGDGVTYPGGMAPVRSFSLAGFEDDVDQGGVLAVEAMCPVKGMYQASLSGMAHLSARVDYLEVV